MAISGDAQAIIDALKEQATLLDNISTNLKTKPAASGTAGIRDDLNFTYVKTAGAELAKSLTNFYLKTDQATKSFGVGMDTFGKKLLDGTKGFNNTLKNSGARFAEQLKSGEITAQDFRDSIENNKKALLELKNAGTITRDQFIDLGRQLIRFREQTLATAAAYERIDPVIKATTKTWEAFDSTVLRLVKTYQTGGDGFNTAANLAKDGLSLMSTFAGKAGGLVGKLGATLSSSTNPLVAGLGVAAVAAGIGLEAFGKASSEVVEKAFPIMQNQVNSMAKSYMAAASTGALFGQGMTEMVQISSDAGLSLETFSNIVKNNSADLAKSGLGVAEGARQIAKVGKVMQDNGTTDQLLKFGYSLEEQGGLIAQTVAKMRAGGGGAVDQQKVAEATAKYAKDLKTLADLTGEDVKTKEKQVQEAANNLAFQQELAQMAPDQREKITRAMEAMEPIERKAFMERMINHGNVMSEETAMMESQSAAFREKSQKSYELALAGQLDLGKQTELTAQYGDSIRKDMLAAKEVAFAAFAGVESVGKLADNMNSMLQQSIKITPEGLEASRKAQEELAKKVAEGGDPLTNKFAELTKQGEALRGALDNLVGTGKAMDAYLDAVKFSTDKMLEYAAKFAGVETSAERQAREQREATEIARNSRIGEAARRGGTISDEHERWYRASERQRETSRISQMTPDQVEAAARQQGVDPDDFLRALGIQGGMAEFTRRQEQQQRMIEMMQNTPMASGGLAFGSDQGFPAMLHGAEAVLPLDNPETMAKVRNSLFGDGDNILTKNTKDIASAMIYLNDEQKQEVVKANESLQRAIMDSQLATARPAMESQDRLFELMNNKFDEMIGLLKDVSDHTELTSARVA